MCVREYCVSVFHHVNNDIEGRSRVVDYLVCWDLIDDLVGVVHDDSDVVVSIREVMSAVELELHVFCHVVVSHADVGDGVSEHTVCEHAVYPCVKSLEECESTLPGIKTSVHGE